MKIEIVELNSLHTATVVSVFYGLFAVLISVLTYTNVGAAAFLAVPVGMVACFTTVFMFCFIYNLYAKKMPRLKLTIHKI